VREKPHNKDPLRVIVNRSDQAKRVAPNIEHCCHSSTLHRNAVGMRIRPSHIYQIVPIRFDRLIVPSLQGSSRFRMPCRKLAQPPLGNNPHVLLLVLIMRTGSVNAIHAVLDPLKQRMGKSQSACFAVKHSRRLQVNQNPARSPADGKKRFKRELTFSNAGIGNLTCSDTTESCGTIATLKSPVEYYRAL
jgi:hypothetical protein